MLLAVWPPPGGTLDDDGLRIALLARHELAVAFAGARLREALEDERHELGAIVDGATDLILQVDAENRVVRLNPAGERLLGTTGRRRPSVGRAPRSWAARWPAATARRTARWPRSAPRAIRSPIARPPSGAVPVRRSASPARTPPTPSAAGPRHPDDGDPARPQRREDPRGAARGVRGHRQPRAAHAAGAHPRLRRDPPPPRARARAAARLRRAHRRGQRAAGGARRPGARRDPPPGRSADPRAIDHDASRPSSRGCAASSMSRAAPSGSS